MFVGQIKFFERYVTPALCLGLTFWRKLSDLIPSANSKPAHSVLFVKLIEQGAIVLHRDCFLEAAEKYGKQNIYICAFAESKPVIDALNIFDEKNVLLLRTTGLLNIMADFSKFMLFVRAQKIDAVLDLEFFSRSSAILCFLTGIKHRVGYHRFMAEQNYRGDLFTHRLNYSHQMHVSQTGRSMLYALETDVAQLPALILPRLTAFSFPAFKPTAEDEFALYQLIDKHIFDTYPVIIINPSFNDVLPLRKWPKENYGLFIKAMHKKNPNSYFVFTGRADEFKANQEFIEELGVKATNTAGKLNFSGLLTLYSKASLLLTSDSGPGHFSSFTQIKTVVLFGPETPTLYGPINKNSVVLYSQLPCSPCINVYNNRFSACKNNLCMKTITPEMVIAAL